MNKNFWIMAGLLIGLAGCSADGVPMLGFDDSGKFIERYTNDNQFRDELTKATAQVQESTFQALQASPADRSGMLRSVVVGLGFNLKVGIDPIVSVGVSPKVRFGFSNSQNPIIP